VPVPELVRVRCNLCGADDTTTVSRRARWSQRARTVACRRCGLVYINPRPGPAELGAFYRERIYTQYMDPAGGFRERLLAASRTQAREIFDHFVNAAGVSPRGLRVLEVGCGLGDFLALARDAGADVLGVEMDGPYADFAERRHRLPLVRGALETLPPSGRFDVIAMFHVLEHLEDPRAALQSLRPRLHPGGRLLIEVPNFMGAWRTPLTEFLRVEHLYHFSPVTLRALLETAGFREVRCDAGPYVFRVIAEPREGGGAVDWTGLHGHHRAVRRHVLIWRLRALALRPYYALRRRWS
jgi:2-polyprenyl-3-methyl-5-hydroxy-6-metoxy-1,4-benzoquinol methylase